MKNSYIFVKNKFNEDIKTYSIQPPIPYHPSRNSNIIPD